MRYGARVICRTPRGLEVGEVLCEATAATLEQLQDPQPGTILRVSSSGITRDVTAYLLKIQQAKPDVVARERERLQEQQDRVRRVEERLQEKADDAAFLTCLDALGEQGRGVSHHPTARNYAIKSLAEACHLLFYGPRTGAAREFSQSHRIGKGK